MYLSGVWGNKIKYSIFGESHGEGIGMVIDGLKSGIELDLDFIKGEMARRAPGKDNLSTTRKEGDNFKILSGFFNGKTTGTPLCVFIENTNKRSNDYDKIKEIIRPSHADYTGKMRYNGFNDYRGGGHFSGRLTAPLMFAGAIAKQILKRKNIIIGSHIKSIKHIEDDYFNDDNLNESTIESLLNQQFPLININKKEIMEEEILKAREEKDSVGGVIECAILNVKPGVGSPFFNSVESTISQLLFSVPGVKGVEFGLGFEITKLNGSEANDELYIEEDIIKTYSNNNGGILGGITNGMPIVFRVAIKPTPSIGKPQRTVDISKMENTILQIEGRHDPCIVKRAVPVIEAVSAMAILELIEEGYNYD